MISAWGVEHGLVAKSYVPGKGYISAVGLGPKKLRSAVVAARKPRSDARIEGFKASGQKKIRDYDTSKDTLAKPFINERRQGQVDAARGVSNPAMAGRIHYAGVQHLIASSRGKPSTPSSSQNTFNRHYAGFGHTKSSTRGQRKARGL